MSDIKLFRTGQTSVIELESTQITLERSLQTQFERHLETLLGVRFLASEYINSHGGRMDTLGLDENGYPVIIEYKRDRSENVISQGLFYLDWLMDHRGNFELLVRDRYGKEAAEQIEWSAPRLICIAADFTKYDIHAVKQMGRNIELVRYRRFGEDLLLLELLTSVSSSTVTAPAASPADGVPKVIKYKTVSEMLDAATTGLTDLYADVENYLLGLGDDVTSKTLRFYFAFRRLKNFACVEVKTSLNLVRLYLKIDPDSVALEEGFTRDVRHVGHYGTGDLEVTLKSHDDLERAKPLIVRSYEAS
ncbi:TRANSPORTER [plant metagenome]|uniref:TRANSPORTER n=1 Tax=plant metagenome TaxID=1297885 RepID=A0A484TNS2_9ZZZZ